ncbi:uncharacterized protein [Anabrus simplex]|uniref:uncharacterized protein isoform X1 n=1 Tax=Anabrus simplex TaxID=316456 RepID=UPI0035A3997E
MSNPRKPPSPPPEALRKLAQLQIERLKKEEEEEQWISGEELYTEGSSDEDDAALRAKRRANEGKGANKTIKGTPYKERKHNLKPRLTSDNTDVSSELVPGIPLKESQFQNLTLSEKADDDSKCDKSSAKSPENRGENAGNSYLSDLNEEQSEISWRPKRGSIKLPNLTSEGLSSTNQRLTVARGGSLAVGEVIHKTSPKNSTDYPLCWQRVDVLYRGTQAYFVVVSMVEPPSLQKNLNHATLYIFGRNH